MPRSQLKRLRESLREQGITGQQKSKKQKIAHHSRPTSEKVERSAALQQIRDSFNPFELRQPSRPAKFATANAKSTANGRVGRYKDVLHRPGITKGAGEEMRRATLLPELQKRRKVGGLIDRRIGEVDVNMTPEEKAAQRFARAQTRRKGGDLFNLEASDDDDGDMPGTQLTHGGRNIDHLEADDFREALSDASDEREELLTRKRQHVGGSDVLAENPSDDHVESIQKKRSRKEVMEEVIAKSKLYKYERQKAKEDDDDLREDLDKDMSDVLALLQGSSTAKLASEPVTPRSTNGSHINPDRQKLLDGADRANIDKEYDTRLRQLAQDTRAKPSERTKTEEEKVAEEAERLKTLEERRLKRMQGEALSEEEESDVLANDETVQRAGEEGGEDTVDEAAAFGLHSVAHPPHTQDKVIYDDEDDFAVDDDLLASNSDNSSDDEASSEPSTSDANGDDIAVDDQDDEFVRGILGDAPDRESIAQNGGKVSQIAFTYPCPRSHDELLRLLEGIPTAEIPTVVQRIRALHHPSLSATSKEAMADFSAALIDHIAFMAAEPGSLATIEQLIRHVHSLSRTYPLEIAATFRKHLKLFRQRGAPTPADLVILTAISSIYPTSDHFHPIVTPAMTLITRFLGLTTALTAQSLTIGVYLVRLALHYQRLSKRYIPEAVRFTLRALSSQTSAADAQRSSSLANLVSMAELWRDKAAFSQIFTPFVPVLTSLSARKELQRLQILLAAAQQRCRPLELHHHRPLPIRSSIPKFEEGFNPDKHYDPDRERSDARKLQKEYKRERKGALRELRKDANFMAREALREKKDRDAAYEKRYKRLVAEIQGEEGREANEYEREKKARKRARR